MPRIHVECDACGGTGLYVGFAEPEGYAVQCSKCAGRGSYWFNYKKAKQYRKRRRGVTRVIVDDKPWFARTANRESATIDVMDFYRAELKKKSSSSPKQKRLIVRKKDYFRNGKYVMHKPMFCRRCGSLAVDSEGIGSSDNWVTVWCRACKKGCDCLLADEFFDHPPSGGRLK